MEGPDSPATAVPTAFTPPPIASRKKAAEAVELYWEAYLRDVPFNDYNSNSAVQQACADLTRFVADGSYTGPTSGGAVTPQLLFRYPYPGATVGPIVSQFLLWPFTYDGITVVPKMRARLPVINWNPNGSFTFNPAGRDYLTEFQEWLNAQNGVPLGNANAFDPTPRFVRSVRDIGNLAGSDNIASVDFRVNLVLGALGVDTDAGNPYNNSTRQSGFATFGAGHLASLIGQAHKGERHAWYHKWFVHRHPRPDGFGGLVNNTLTGRATYPLHPDLLNSPVMTLIASYNQQVNTFRGKSTATSFLLPMELTNGSPNHPASPAGHAITVGSCVTAMKAWFDTSPTIVSMLAASPGTRAAIVAARGTGNATGFNPVIATRDGLGLNDYTGPDAGLMTVDGELNKVVHNLSEGRNMSGVHWRIGCNYGGNWQGQEIVKRTLNEAKATYPEPGASFHLTQFDGTTITI
jgi:hypothetical protein